MTSRKRSLNFSAQLLSAGALWTVCSATAQAVDAPADSVEPAVLAMEAAAGAPVEVTRSPVTDLVSFVATSRDHPISRRAMEGRRPRRGARDSRPLDGRRRVIERRHARAIATWCA